MVAAANAAMQAGYVAMLFTSVLFGFAQGLPETIQPLPWALPTGYTALFDGDCADICRELAPLLSWLQGYQGRYQLVQRVPEIDELVFAPLF